jgi:hypothetical protein
MVVASFHEPHYGPGTQSGLSGNEKSAAASAGTAMSQRQNTASVPNFSLFFLF